MIASRRMASMLIGVGVMTTAVALGGCHTDHVQSAIHPAGPGAVEIAKLWWAMFALLTMVFLGTMLLLGLALVKRPKVSGPPLGDTRFVVLTGIIVPAAILVVMLLVSLRATVTLRTPEADLTIRITGHQWWWEVEYPDHGVKTANEFYIPVGEPVLLELKSADVIHSLWVPNLTGKMDMIPERTNIFWLQANRPGEFRGQCAEYCGLQHAWMALWVIALPRDEFDAWLEARQQPPPEPWTDEQRRGREVFFAEDAGCHACHAIRGTEAIADVGPDLTHIASRRSLGAATIPNTPDMLLRWIADPHQFKPGNHMPETEVSNEELVALVEYLMTLE